MPSAMPNARHATAPASHRTDTYLIRYRRPKDRRCRAQRWREAVTELLALQAEYAAWHDALPETLATPRLRRRCRPSSSSTSTPRCVVPPRGYGRD